jgi:hypothetical protein
MAVQLTTPRIAKEEQLDASSGAIHADLATLRLETFIRGTYLLMQPSHARSREHFSKAPIFKLPSGGLGSMLS